MSVQHAVQLPCNYVQLPWRPLPRRIAVQAARLHAQLHAVRLAPNRKATRRAAPASRRRPAAAPCEHLGFSPCGCVLRDEPLTEASATIRGVRGSLLTFYKRQGARQ
jgi:hypothetical protein